jgi:hypothetical protein
MQRFIESCIAPGRRSHQRDAALDQTALLPSINSRAN